MRPILWTGYFSRLGRVCQVGGSAWRWSRNPTWSWTGFSWVEMATQAAGLCLLLAIALSSPVEQGIILGSVINMDGWNSQRGEDTRYLLQEHRWGLERLTSAVWFPGRVCQSWKPIVRFSNPLAFGSGLGGLIF